MKRKETFKEGQIYHIFNKSIANYGIFIKKENGQQFIKRLFYYNDLFILKPFSLHLRKNPYFTCKSLISDVDFSKVKFLAYNIMPDHYHLLLKLLRNNILSKYIGDVENSYTKFFNTKYKRRGPLWQSNFKVIRIKNNEQLLHVSRYIHLNPTTKNLVKKPEDWELSSYREFITNPKILKEIVVEISIKSPRAYKEFVENRLNFQKKLRMIKKLILE